jgi:hypothetical protein
MINAQSYQWKLLTPMTASILDRKIVSKSLEKQWVLPFFCGRSRLLHNNREDIEFT